MCGENFLLRSEGTVKRLGFYTTRFVEAFDEDDAEYRAVEALHDEHLRRTEILNDEADPPLVFAERIDEIAPGASVRERWSGLTFFEDPRVLH
jgi:hypothetical protein